MNETDRCSVVTSSRFAYRLAGKHGGNVWRSTRRDADEPHITVWFCVTRIDEQPSDEVEPGGWKLLEKVEKKG